MRCSRCWRSRPWFPSSERYDAFAGSGAPGAPGASENGSARFAPGTVGEQVPVDLAGEHVHRAGQLGVALQLELLLDEVVIGLRLLEHGLPVLADHDERRQEDRFERHHQGELRPRVRLDEQHPGGERDRMDVDERHRAGEARDRVGGRGAARRRPAPFVGQRDRVGSRCRRCHKLADRSDGPRRHRYRTRCRLRDCRHDACGALDATRRCPNEQPARPVPVVLRAAHRARVRRLRRAVAVVGRGPGGVLGCRVGLLRGARPAPYERVLGEREMPGARWFPGARSTTPSTRCAPADRAARRRRDRRGGRRAAPGSSSPGPSSPTRWRRAGRPAAPRRRRGRPRRRLPAEHPRDGRRVPRRRPASARSGRRARRSSARRPSSTASARSSRRCCSPSTATATASGTIDRRPRWPRSGPRCRRLEHTWSCRTRRARSRAGDASSWWHDAARRAGPLEFEPVAVRPPAVRALLVGHHRPAEGDRARPRRHPARAPEGARPAPRPRRPATASSGSPPPAG